MTSPQASLDPGSCIVDHENKNIKFAFPLFSCDRYASSADILISLLGFQDDSPKDLQWCQLALVRDAVDDVGKDPRCRRQGPRLCWKLCWKECDKYAPYAQQAVRIRRKGTF